MAITISNLPQDLGNINKNFILKYIVTDDAGTAQFNVTEQIDNTIIASFVVNAEAVNTLTVDVIGMNTGNHTLTITAEGGGQSASF